MGAQKNDESPKKQPPRAPATKPAIHTDVVRKLQEKRSLQRAQDLTRDVNRTIAHIDQVTELSHEAFDRKNEYLAAAKTGNDPKINELAKKKAAVAKLPRKEPKMECSGGVCRIIPRKKKK
jgi:hypothetical protein